MTAGVISVEINDGETSNLTSSPTVTLVDEGVRDGTLVRLPNLGGQWADNFAQPVLDVEAVASSPSIVLDRMNALQVAIQDALNRRQDAAGVDQFNRITVQLSPSATDVQYRSGDHKRALVVVALLGMSLTLAAVVLNDRILRIQGKYPTALRTSKIGRSGKADQLDAPIQAAGRARQDPKKIVSVSGSSFNGRR